MSWNGQPGADDFIGRRGVRLGRDRHRNMKALGQNVRFFLGLRRLLDGNTIFPSRFFELCHWLRRDAPRLQFRVAKIEIADT